MAKKQEELLKEIDMLLRNRDFETQNVLADIVAAICDVDVADMLSPSAVRKISQARWLFWLACYRLEQEPFEEFAKKTSLDGFTFSDSGVRRGVYIMDSMIRKERKWRERWEAVITAYNAIEGKEIELPKKENKPHRLTLTVPKALKDQIQITIKTEQ